MIPVQSYLTSTMNDQELRAVYSLLWKVWPGQNSFEEAFARFKNKVVEKNTDVVDRLRFVVWKDNQIVAHASIFAREVHTDHRSIRLGGLAAVCTYPDYRKRGFGAQVVRAAFELIDHGTFPVALWMTTVPDFYKKLGARIIENTWVNTKNIEDPKTDPWPDEEKMIYPASYTWPTGQIDLNGPTY